MTVEVKSEFDTLIEGSGLKLKAIAEELDVSPATLWKLRKDPKKLNAVQMERLSKLFNVNISEVFEAIKNS